jgi:hypothetical protein
LLSFNILSFKKWEREVFKKYVILSRPKEGDSATADEACIATEQYSDRIMNSAGLSMNVKKPLVFTHTYKQFGHGRNSCETAP